MHSRIGSIEFTSYNDSEVVDDFFESLCSRYQWNLEKINVDEVFNLI